MGMPVQEIPGTLQAGYGTGNGGAGSCGSLKEVFDRRIGQPGEAGEALPPTEEGPESPRQRDDHVAMGHRCQDLPGDELAEGRLALGVTGRTEAALLAREGEQVLVAAVRTANAGKAPGEHATPVCFCRRGYAGPGP